MSFDVNSIIDNLSKMELYSLTKPQLKLVADKIVIEYESNTKKAELRQAILDYLFGEDLIPEEQPPPRNNLPQVTENWRSDDLN